MKELIIGIDASNLLEGGGVTHLEELIRHSNPDVHGFNKIIIWGSKITLSRISDHHWIEKKENKLLERGLLLRLFWKVIILRKELKKNNCNILFSPGGSDISNFKPMVTMCRNMLPFEKKESLRFGYGFKYFKFILLKYFQSKTFEKANGLIFLTKYASDIVNKSISIPIEKYKIIPHGISDKFFIKPRDISILNKNKIYNIIYVSKIDPYKHHINVVEAVSRLVENSFKINLILIGPRGESSKKLDPKIDEINKKEKIIEYLGSIQYDLLYHYYKTADIALFASSCENMPNILLESMASGLPIACSNKGPMPEILENCGLYFNPESIDEIYFAISQLIESPILATELAEKSFKKVQEFSWEKCANSTFNYLNHIVNDYNKNEI
jgi:glycosyltransferase involved in cell wall biosynthesis